MISSRIICDSKNPAMIRLTTAIMKYPLWMHNELMTHRVFSRNAASSRAIPFEKMVRDIQYDPACPVYWGKEKRGMSVVEQVDAPNSCREMWLLARDRMIDDAQCIQRVYQLHKGTLNRLLSPWMWMTTLVTGSEWGWNNFFALRAHPDAMPEFQMLAYGFLDQYLASTALITPWLGWHIPRFESMMESEADDKALGYQIKDVLKVATARCARLSYLTFDGNHELLGDLNLHKKLAEAGHWSPFEHCAQAICEDNPGFFKHYPWSNFDRYSYDHEEADFGYAQTALRPSYWGQYRKLFPLENRHRVNLEYIAANKPAWIATLQNENTNKL